MSLVVMNRTQFKAAGKALFGTRWQTEMAKALGVSDRTVRRWASGNVPIPADLHKNVDRLLVTCIDVVKQMRKVMH